MISSMLRLGALRARRTGGIAPPHDRKARLPSRPDEALILRSFLHPHDYSFASRSRSCRAMHRHPPGGVAPRHQTGPLRLPLGPRRRTSRLLLLLPTAAALALAAAGCGGGSGGSSTAATTSSATTSSTTTASTAAGKATTLNLEADSSGALKFDKSTLSAGSGKVTIVMANPSPLTHDIAIQGNGVDVKGAVVGQGGTSTVSADLKPGTYTFLCTVDGHAAAGMKGTLTVK